MREPENQPQSAVSCGQCAVVTREQTIRTPDGQGEILKVGTLLSDAGAISLAETQGVSLIPATETHMEAWRMYGNALAPLLAAASQQTEVPPAVQTAAPPAEPPSPPPVDTAAEESTEGDE